MSSSASTWRWEDHLDANFEQTRVRCLELFLVCDSVLRELSRYWELHLGEHRAVIRDRMHELGIEADDELVEHLVEALVFCPHYAV